MGYDITLLVVDKGHLRTELEYNTDAPYDPEDGGFPLRRDAHGEFVRTGREICYCSVIATIDLCKPDYTGVLYWLNKECRPPENSTLVNGFFPPAGRGHEEVTEDCYGCPLGEASLQETIDALSADNTERPYRRYIWALALLTAIRDNAPPEDVAVLFYGSL